MEDTQEVQPLTTRDMLNHALEGNPANMASVFNDLVMGKVAAAVADRKADLAQTMFADESDESDDESEEEDEDLDLSDDEESEQQEDEAEDEDTESDA
jgi:hypothetical protein